MRARKYTSFDVEGEGTCHMVLSAQGFVYFEFMAGAAEAMKHQEPFLLPTEIFRVFAAAASAMSGRCVGRAYQMGLLPRDKENLARRKHVLRWGGALHIPPFWSSCQSSNSPGVS